MPKMSEEKFAEALADKRCAVRGVAWVRRTYGLHPIRARRVVRKVQRRLGDGSVDDMLTQRKIRQLRAGLMEYESQKRGILRASLDGGAYRKVAARYKVSAGVIWYMRERIMRLSKLTRMPTLSVIRGIENDLK